MGRGVAGATLGGATWGGGVAGGMFGGVTGWGVPVARGGEGGCCRRQLLNPRIEREVRATMANRACILMGYGDQRGRGYFFSKPMTATPIPMRLRMVIIPAGMNL